MPLPLNASILISSLNA